MSPTDSSHASTPVASPRAARRAASRRPPRVRPKTLRAEAKRATQPRLVRLFSLLNLGALPLPLPDPWSGPPSPKRAFRSCYRPRSAHALRRRLAALPVTLTTPPLETLVEVGLFLVDLSPWRPRLLQLTLADSARGETPFDPLSLLVICLWKIAAALPWTTVATRLAHFENGAGWRRLAGFRDDDPPGESTLRAFRDRLPDELFDQVLQFFLALLAQHGLLPDPAVTHGYLLVGDGQRHQARTIHRCHHAVASCYQALAPGQQHPCPAQEKSHGQYFCACDTPACQERCALAPRLDREASYSVYSHEKARAAGKPTPTPEAERAPDGVDGVFGYRSVAGRLVDIQLHAAWNVHTDVTTATTDEGTFFPRHLAGVCANLPDPQLGYVLYDSATSEQPCLDAVYDRGGIPLFALKADPSDDDPDQRLTRGYDEQGTPLCHQGFRLTWQGLDRNHQPPRARWVCQHVCRHRPAGAVADCPYLDKKRGQHVYVQRTLPGGNYRLARLVPPGSRRWKQIMGWRNTGEGRNSVLEHKGLKHLPDYGLAHAAFLIGWADVLENLCTLARLVIEATQLDERFQPQEKGARPRPIRVEAGAPVDAEPAEEEEEAQG